MLVGDGGRPMGDMQAGGDGIAWSLPLCRAPGLRNLRSATVLPRLARAARRVQGPRRARCVSYTRMLVVLV